MSTHNICFMEKLRKNSQSYHQILLLNKKYSCAFLSFHDFSILKQCNVDIAKDSQTVLVVFFATFHTECE